MAPLSGLSASQPARILQPREVLPEASRTLLSELGDEASAPRQKSLDEEDLLKVLAGGAGADREETAALASKIQRLAPR